MAPTVQEPLFSFISDQTLALLLPIVVYWVYSLIFHWMSLQEFPWLERYRLHSKEEETRNKVDLPDVIKAVVVQQLLQTALGYLAVLADDSQMIFDDELALTRYQLWFSRVLLMIGLDSTMISPPAVMTMAQVCYFYLEPLFRFTVAMSILDTWQYFLHRLFHNVPILYRHFHSRHHRLYVTYAFGALYNHPFEGFMMDSVGAGLAFLISGMGNRGALAFFSFSTLKTLDDHCGYNLPFNPLQLIFSNNADYHDIHHQHFGIKSNFSQPFGTMWDHLLGTYMSREEANEIIRKRQERRAAIVAAAAASGQKLSASTSPSVLSKSTSPFGVEEDIHSSGNNSGNDTQARYGVDNLWSDSSDDDDNVTSDGVLRPEQLSLKGGVSVANIGTGKGSLPQGDQELQGGQHKEDHRALFETSMSGLRERLSARAHLDNGFVSGKGQGKAL